MSEGKGLSGYFKGISLKIFSIMFKFEDNPFNNNKITANNSKNKQKLDF
jgi:hypothetical protein